MRTVVTQKNNMTTLKDYLRDIVLEAINFEIARQEKLDDRSRAQIAEDLATEYLEYIKERLIGE